jgi:hypothetical protein
MYFFVAKQKVAVLVSFFPSAQSTEGALARTVHLNRFVSVRGIVRAAPMFILTYG